MRHAGRITDTTLVACVAFVLGAAAGGLGVWLASGGENPPPAKAPTDELAERFAARLLERADMTDAERAAERADNRRYDAIVLACELVGDLVRDASDESWLDLEFDDGDPDAFVRAEGGRYLVTQGFSVREDGFRRRRSFEAVVAPTGPADAGLTVESVEIRDGDGAVLLVHRPG